MNCGNKIDKKWSIFGEAPIHQTIKSSKGENIRTLQTVLDCGADINLIDVNGWTALHYAAKKVIYLYIYIYIYIGGLQLSEDST